MEYLSVYFTITAVLAQQVSSRPEWPLFHPHGPTALPVIQHNGFIADTHEVAAAKNAHLAALAAHAHHGPTALPLVQHNGFISDTHEVAAAKNAHLAALAAHVHHRPTALPLVQHNGFIADTHEVAAAKNAHLAALAAHTHHETHNYPVHHANYEHEYIQQYHGPLAIPVVLHNGHLADTPEVALEKSHHLAAVAKAKADKYYSGHQEYSYGGAYGYSGSHHGYGIPVVLPSGHIADTHEVAAAKSAHLLAVAKTKADNYYSGHGEGYGYGGGHGYSGSYHGYGIPVVLPNGHLADTHEVAAAKAAHLSAVAHAQAEQAHSNYYHDEYDHHHHESLTHPAPHTVPHYEGHIEHPFPHHSHSAHAHPHSTANVWFFG